MTNASTERTNERRHPLGPVLIPICPQMITRVHQSNRMNHCLWDNENQFAITWGTQSSVSVTFSFCVLPSLIIYHQRRWCFFVIFSAIFCRMFFSSSASARQKEDVQSTLVSIELKEAAVGSCTQCSKCDLSLAHRTSWTTHLTVGSTVVSRPQERPWRCPSRDNGCRFAADRKDPSVGYAMPPLARIFPLDDILYANDSWTVLQPKWTSNDSSSPRSLLCTYLEAVVTSTHVHLVDP